MVWGVSGALLSYSSYVVALTMLAGMIVARCQPSSPLRWNVDGRACLRYAYIRRCTSLSLSHPLT